MKVKAIDIARQLGISKATVSLALNGKEGVKEETRRVILACKEEMESRAKGENQARLLAGNDRKLVKVLSITNGLRMIQDSEIDLWTDVLQVFEKYLKQSGYDMSVSYLDIRRDTADGIASLCNKDDIAGVIVVGAEMLPQDYIRLAAIHKPLVMYDGFTTDDQYSYVMIDNRQGVELAVEELFSKGNRDIIYLAYKNAAYNLQSRRLGFIGAMEKRGIANGRDYIVETGDCIRECHLFMRQYLKEHQLPQAFLMDSYHVSIGTFQALLEMGTKIPEEVSLIGIDILPPYMTGGIKMTGIRVSHTAKSYWTVQLLLQEIAGAFRDKCKMYMNCELIPGDSVAVRK